MNDQNILFETEGPLALLTLNRPQSLNSFTSDMHAELRDALRRVSADDAIRAALITGAGRGFCAGQDLGDRSAADAGETTDLGETVERHYNPLVRMLSTMAKPVVCAVNGVAAGAGASIALACDIVLAARSAKFVQAFANIGLVPDSGGTWNLPRAMGLPRARALAMLGERIGAEQAAEWGMIWRCVDDEQLMDAAKQTALRLAEQPPLAMAAIKRLLRTGASASMDEQLERERETMQRLGFSEDYAEGVSAFLDKRTPSYRGR